MSVLEHGHTGSSGSSGAPVSRESAGARDPLRPLADRMRPRSLDEFVGQQHLLGPGKPLRHAIETGQLHSLILWGPPGTGKTTLARLIAQKADAQFIALSAVMAGVKDIRAAVEAARHARESTGRPTLLFLDEVHRFNKAQQDTFLPYLEDGTLTFVGATTENPSFEVISALLSRARVYVLRALSVEDLTVLLQAALRDADRGLGAERLQAEPAALDLIARAADGDARRALNMLELAAGLLAAGGAARVLTVAVAQEVAAGGQRRFDKGGDQFYEQISALHKAVRGSDPDGALYWLCRMLDGGWRAWRWRTSDSRIHARSHWHSMAGRPTSVSGPRKASWPSPRWWCISPARPRATRCTSPWARPWRTSASSARWRCRCGCATRRRA